MLFYYETWNKLRFLLFKQSQDKAFLSSEHVTKMYLQLFLIIHLLDLRPSPEKDI